MDKILLFIILSIPVVVISRRTLFHVKSHGFYRFFSWECIIWLFVSNSKFWFEDPLSIRQVFSWIFLLISIYLVISGVIDLKKKGKPEKNRDEKTLYAFEKTTALIEHGIFRYIRHPLYSSLLFLTWGIFLKNPAVLLLVPAFLSTVSLYLTAIFEEKECIVFFGDPYQKYMDRSKMFIPFII